MDICQLFSNVYITNYYIARSRSQWDIPFLRSVISLASCSQWDIPSSSCSQRQM